MARFRIIKDLELVDSMQVVSYTFSQPTQVFSTRARD